jgi:hypothetical protein
MDASSLGDAMLSLVTAMEVRQTSATRMNAESSRSHLIFTVSITQHLVDCQSVSKTRTGDTLSSCIHFVDLAGSERMSTAHGTAPIRVLSGEDKAAARDQRRPTDGKFHNTDRFQEMTTINSGLTSLGRVVRALATGAGHIPYHDSFLTAHLKQALGGNCRTALLVSISQHPADGGESLASMRFGQSMACIKVTVKQKFQSSAHRDNLTRYYQLLISDTLGQYNALRKLTLQQHLHEMSRIEAARGERLTEAQQTEQLRNAIAAGRVLPHLPSATTKEWALIADTDRRFRADMTLPQRLCFQYERHVRGLLDAAGTMYGKALARTPVYATPEEAEAIRTSSLSNLMLGARKALRPSALRLSAEPLPSVIANAAKHVSRTTPKKNRPTSKASAAAPVNRAAAGVFHFQAAQAVAGQSSQGPCSAAGAARERSGGGAHAQAERHPKSAGNTPRRTPGWRSQTRSSIRARVQEDDETNNSQGWK